MNKKILLFFALSILFTANQQAKAQLHNNGPLSTGALTASNFAVPSGYTWSELQNNTGNTTQANSTAGLPGYYYTDGSTSYTLADDFTVPVDHIYGISSFDFFCYEPIYGGTVPPINAMRIRIYNTNPALPGATPIYGDLTTNVYDATNSENAFIYRVFNSLYPSPQQPNFSRKLFRVRGSINVSLNPGQYWVEFQVHATDNTEIFFPPVTVVGSRSVVGANSKINVIASIFPSDILGWGNNIDTGIPNTAPDVALDLPFIINGIALNVNETNFESNITLFPNPVEDTFTITNSSAKAIDKVELFDINSRLIKKIEPNNTAEILIDMSQLSSGIYYVKIASTDESIVVKKVVKN